MLPYKKYEQDNLCSSPSGSSKKEEPRYPRCHIKVPEGMTGIELNKEVQVTIRGKIIGFSNYDWQDCVEIELELHAADMSNPKDANVFSNMADED